MAPLPCHWKCRRCRWDTGTASRHQWSAWQRCGTLAQLAGHWWAGCDETHTSLYGPLYGQICAGLCSLAGPQQQAPDAAVSHCTLALMALAPCKRSVQKPAAKASFVQVEDFKRLYKLQRGCRPCCWRVSEALVSSFSVLPRVIRPAANPIVSRPVCCCEKDLRSCRLQQGRTACKRDVARQQAIQASWWNCS